MAAVLLEPSISVTAPMCSLFICKLCPRAVMSCCNICVILVYCTLCVAIVWHTVFKINSWFFGSASLCKIVGSTLGATIGQQNIDFFPLKKAAERNWKETRVEGTEGNPPRQLGLHTVIVVTSTPAWGVSSTDIKNQWHWGLRVRRRRDYSIKSNARFFFVCLICLSIEQLMNCAVVVLIDFLHV